ncbi:MAG: ribonuclease [Bacteroidota bacterium]|jgi:ribonuclease HI
MNNSALIYTDGSCHTQLEIGAWASIIFVDDKKIILSETVENTTHQRMELLAVISALHYILKNYAEIKLVKIISDSQYVIGLMRRKEKLTATDFKTKAQNEVRNTDLVKELLRLSDIFKIEFEKIKAHQKQTDITNYNIEVDKLCRNKVREAVKKIES